MIFKGVVIIIAINVIQYIPLCSSEYFYIAKDTPCFVSQLYMRPPNITCKPNDDFSKSGFNSTHSWLVYDSKKCIARIDTIIELSSTNCEPIHTTAIGVPSKNGKDVHGNVLSEKDTFGGSIL